MTRPCPDLDLDLNLDLEWDLEWDLELDKSVTPLFSGKCNEKPKKNKAFKVQY